MLKALFKKQMLELGTWFYQNKKTGQRRTTAGIAGYAVFYAFLLLCIGIMFFAMGSYLCAPLAEAGMGWLYFVIMGLTAVLLGVFGSVFNTYSALYKAKDNELLLAMPIPAPAILAVRLFGVWFWGFVYEALALSPQ